MQAIGKRTSNILVVAGQVRGSKSAALANQINSGSSGTRWWLTTMPSSSRTLVAGLSASTVSANSAYQSSTARHQNDIRRLSISQPRSVAKASFAKRIRRLVRLHEHARHHSQRMLRALEGCMPSPSTFAKAVRHPGLHDLLDPAGDTAQRWRELGEFQFRLRNGNAVRKILHQRIADTETTQYQQRLRCNSCNRLGALAAGTESHRQALRQ